MEQKWSSVNTDNGVIGQEIKTNLCYADFFCVTEKMVRRGKHQYIIHFFFANKESYLWLNNNNTLLFSALLA